MSGQEEIKIEKGWKRFGCILEEEKFQGDTTVGRFGFFVVVYFLCLFF